MRVGWGKVLSLDDKRALVVVLSFVGCARGIVGVVIVVSSVSFLAYRLERSSEPKAHELLVFKEGCYIASVPLKH